MHHYTASTQASNIRTSVLDRVAPIERTHVRKHLVPSDSGATTHAGDGLVTYAITSRESVSPGQKVSKFRFADAEECRAGAAAVGAWEWNGREGAVPQIEVAPGLIRLTAPDLNRRERSANRAADRPHMASDGLVSDDVASLLETIGEMDAEEGSGETRGVVRGWSRKSRARMVSTLAELDLMPLFMSGDRPAMVTLTYPRKWEVVAGDAEVVKGHFSMLLKRWARAWGGEPPLFWKMEFQRRGAPHFHILAAPKSGVARGSEWAEYEMKLAVWESAGRPGRRPYWRSQVGDGLPFREWLSVVWADVVGHPDPGERARHELAGAGVDYVEGDRGRDPKRAAVYFGKHGTFADKEYQHEPPELWLESGKSVGRFWGYRGLEKVKGAATLEFDTMLFMARILRKYGTKAKVWNRDTQSHEFRPVLRSVYRPRRKISADGTVKPMRDADGEVLIGEDGLPVDAVRYRKQTMRATRMSGPMGAGFVLVNDGPSMARALARAVDSCRGDADGVPVGMRGSVLDRDIRNI